jgi:hypothetical protein
VGLFFRPRRPIARLAAGGLVAAVEPACPSKGDVIGWPAPHWAAEAPAYTPPVDAAPGRRVGDETAAGAE